MVPHERYTRFKSSSNSALTLRKLGDTSLPNQPPEMLDDDFLKTLHHVLLEVRHSSYDTSIYLTPCSQIHVEEGIMICPNCKHNYPISNGIPNMVKQTDFLFAVLTDCVSCLPSMKSVKMAIYQDSSSCPRCSLLYLKKMSGLQTGS